MPDLAQPTTNRASVIDAPKEAQRERGRDEQQDGERGQKREHAADEERERRRPGEGAVLIDHPGDVVVEEAHHKE